MISAIASHSRTPGAIASTATPIARDTIRPAARIISISAGDFTSRTQLTSGHASTSRASGSRSSSST